MAESSVAALGMVDPLYRLPFNPLVTRDNHLAYPLAILDLEWLLGEVYDDNADLAAVVAVDCPGSVDQRNPVLYRQAAARTYLALVSLGS